jgi:hypothetical protein
MQGSLPFWTISAKSRTGSHPSPSQPTITIGRRRAVIFSGSMVSMASQMIASSDQSNQIVTLRQEVPYLLIGQGAGLLMWVLIGTLRPASGFGQHLGTMALAGC